MGERTLPPEIARIYGAYFDELKRLAAERKPGDGLLGFGKRPDSDPCHNRFAGELEEALDAVAAGAPSSGTVRTVLRYIYEGPLVHADNALAYWMLLAVHGLTDRLIPCLTLEDAAELSVWYAEAYPKRVRLPAQKRLAAQLRKQAGEGKEEQHGAFRFWPH